MIRLDDLLDYLAASRTRLVLASVAVVLGAAVLGSALAWLALSLLLGDLIVGGT